MSIEQPIYVPRCIAREKTFPNGGSVMSLSFHAESLATFIKEHTNERGYVNLVVSRRREIGKHDETHTVKLDTWKPKEGFQKMREAAQATAAPEPTPPTQEDIPF